MSTPLSFSGVMPSLHVKANLLPRRSECGIGALMPWADKLWLVSYVAHTRTTGAGTGLYEIGDDMIIRKHPDSVVGTYANRMVHGPSNQLLIGPHIIDVEGQVRTVEALVDYRLTATMEHLEDRENKVYHLTMEGELLELDLNTLEVRVLFDLVKELEIPFDPETPNPFAPGSRTAQPHFKGGHTMNGRVVVANNTYDERDFNGTWQSGRLAEWDGSEWRVLEHTAFMEVAGRTNLSKVMYTTGWDKASALLKVHVNGQWSTYRLPKASHGYDYFWSTEWTRIREVEHERFLMDCHGMFYELLPVAYNGKVWGVRPISTHLRVVPDFCSWRGMLVMAVTPATPNGEANLHAGDLHAGLWFGKTDDLWQFGKPKGWGGPWCRQKVAADEPSDPYLMTGFEHKGLHLKHDSSQAVNFKVEVDFLGDGDWSEYKNLTVRAGEYIHHEFPTGFAAHWVRITIDKPCTATAYFMYT